MKSLVFFLALLFERIHAQAIHLLPAEPFLHSGAYSIRFADPFSFTANSAALAFYDRVGAGVFGQKKFLLKELSSLQAAAYSPVSFGALGFCTQYNGDANYNETEFGLAYGKKLGSIAIGCRFNYRNIRIAGYGNSAAFYADVATLWQSSDKLMFGVGIRNINRAHIGSRGEELLSVVFSMGCGYEISEQLLLAAEIRKAENSPIDFRPVLHYYPTQNFFLRAGLASGMGSPWMSTGWRRKNFRIDITASYHLALGISPGLSLIVHVKNKEK